MTMDTIASASEFYQKEVAHRLSEASNPERFEFFKKLLNLMPDDELKRVEVVAHNALKRRCRQKKKGTVRLSAKRRKCLPKKLQKFAPVSESPDSVPASNFEDPEEQPGPSVGWYREYDMSDWLFLDCEKVEIKCSSQVKNSKGKQKLYEMKAGEVGICDINGKKVYESLIYREPGSFRVNRHAKNQFLREDSLMHGRPLEKVQADLLRIFEGKVIVGCDLAQDFESLDLEFGSFSEDCFDLQWEYYDESVSTRGKPIRERWSLKRMCKELLGKAVQGGIHGAMEDAVSTADVFKNHYMKIKPEPTQKLNRF